MNILYLAHRIPYPPNKGDKLRAFRQIEHLSRRHRIWCACFIDDPHDIRHIQTLKSHCVDVVAIELQPLLAKTRGLWLLARGRTITEGYYANREMTSLLDYWQKSIRFDAIIAFSSSMARYALAVPATRRILDLCDLDSLKWGDYAEHLSLKLRRKLVDRAMMRLYRKESARLAAAELRWIDGFDAAILATQAEAAPLQTLVAPRKIHVIGNGVDVPKLNDAETRSLSPERTQWIIDNRQSTISGIVGFVGVMDYLPNIDAVTWFAFECWAGIRQRFPQAQFRIVGRNPTRAIRRLARIAGVQVIGEMADVAGEVRRFDVSVAPLRIARGVQNKVLEAMGAAKPVVLTSKAARGIGAVANSDYCVADSPGEFAGAVCSLLADMELREKIGRSGLMFVAAHRRWRTELEKIESLLTKQITKSNMCRHIPTSPSYHDQINSDPSHDVIESALHFLP